jgi:hypothetical protein
MPYYTTKAAAQLLGRAVVTIRLIVRENELGEKVGRDWVLTEDEFQKLREIVENAKHGRPFGSKNKPLQ